MMPHLSGNGQKHARRKASLHLEELEPRSLLSTISGGAYSLLSDRVGANPATFFVYRDGDSGQNHGFPSGKFAKDSDLTIINGIGVNTSFVDNATGLGRVRGTVLQVTFPGLPSGQFAGLNIEEPENWGTTRQGFGYDLRGATQVVFDVRSTTPGGIRVQFGVGGKVTDLDHSYLIPNSFTTLAVPLAMLRDPGTNAPSPPDLSSVHILFSVSINDMNAPTGGTVLLDNIHFEPVPSSHAGVPSLPLDTQSFGVVPVLNPPVNQPIPPDQANRNISTIYATALTEISLLNRGAPTDLAGARQMADTLVYALHNDIKGAGMQGDGDPLPTAPDGSAGLHNAYSSGDLPLFNDQQIHQGKKGQTRLSGFTGPAGFELILDGATGGNDAFAILALAAAFRRFGDARYLNAAREIGRWITANLTDTTGTGYGGYFLGYPDMGKPKIVQPAKSIENNADIFAAFMELAAIEGSLGNPNEAADWTSRANVAGDFVMALYDAPGKRFNAGTVPFDATPMAGIDPSGPRMGNEVINQFDFLDSNSFPILALASFPRYRNQIDWRDPTQYIVDHFAQTITAGGQTFRGFDIVSQPTATPGDGRPTPGPNGIAWEFTGQAVETLRFVDALYGVTRFETLADLYVGEIFHAQIAAPFGDGRGLVGATVQGGDQLSPLDQGLTTPFQFIPERVGLPATTWAILADTASNLFAPRFKAAPLPDVSDIFVQALYGDFLGRSAGASEVVTWRQRLVGGGSAPVINGVVRSDEGYGRLVANVFSYFLNRPPAPNETAGFLGALQRGAGAEFIITTIVGSVPFGQIYPGDDGFVRAVGKLLLCRDLGISEVNTWLSRLPDIGRGGVVRGFLASAEFRGLVVKILYGSRPMSAMPCLTFIPDLLHRMIMPTDKEVANWVNSGLDILGIEVRIASSLEYFSRGNPQASPNFIESLYRDALLRPASAPEAASWKGAFVARGAAAIGSGIEGSREAHNRVVDSWYARYLGRAPGGNEEAGWVNQLLAGATEEQVLSRILGSAEFFNRAQGLVLSGMPNERFVQALYQLLLERTASPGEVAGWLPFVAANGREATAFTFMATAEYRGLVVRTYYSALLRRTASAADVDRWVPSGLDLATIRVRIESSLEFNLNG